MGVIKEFLLISLLITGCGDSPSMPEPEATPTPTPEIVVVEELENPSCNMLMSAADGANGFLWKPESDSAGNLVVLLPARFVKQFEEVLVELATGTVESLNFTGFSNGERQTWRGESPGKFYRDKGAIVAIEASQNCSWQLPGRAARRHD